VANKVESIIKDKEEAENAIDGVKRELEDKIDKVEELKRVAKEKKAEMEDLRDQFEDNKSDLNRAQFKIKALEKKVQSAKVQTDEKLEEIDKLYNETDFLKNELGNIRAKYDFSSIDRTKAALERYEIWSLKAIQVTNSITQTFESYFNCGICNNLATKPVTVEPCGHTFCKTCMEN